MAFSGHKMCGPGVGVLWGRAALLEMMPPFLFGGDMIRTVKRDTSKWNELPYKFEAGTPAIAEVVALGAAVDYLSTIGMSEIHDHVQDVLGYALERLPEVPGLRILGPGLSDRGGVASFVMDIAHPHDISAILDAHGVCVRAGHHCAQPLHDRFCVPATARASFYIYNDRADVDALIEALYDVITILGRH
jgi:cysteine desulfurase/selenocysteine lyase